MKNYNIYYRSSLLGLQIIYNNLINEKQVISIGNDKHYEYEVHLDIANIRLDGKETLEQIPFTLYYRGSVNELSDNRTIGIPQPNTLIIQYPKNLFNIFTIKEQFEANNSLIEIFKNELYIQKASITGALNSQDSYILENILLILSKNIIIQEVVYKCSCLISRIIIGKICIPGDAGLPIHPSLINLEKIIATIIENNFNYPTPKEIRKFTNSTKRNFEAKIRSIGPSSLKDFQTDLQFKSCLYKILYTEDDLQLIALEHGFSEYTSFTRSIKLRTGFTAKLLRLKSKRGLLTLLPNLSLYKIIPQSQSNDNIEKYLWVDE